MAVTTATTFGPNSEDLLQILENVTTSVCTMSLSHYIIYYDAITASSAV